jgi:aspartate aminotransferase-like enzyme
VNRYLKTYLMTPGPTPVPESISSIFSQPIIHHRTPAFQTLFEDVRANLKYLYQTKQDVLILAASGTGAMEAAVTNLFRKGDKVITIAGGKFGERWTKISKVYGLSPIEITLEPGDSLEPKQLEDVVRANPDARGVLFQASETSTGARMPTQEICKIAKGANMLSVCDAITACGVFDLPMDEWGIDCLITGSQKALMIPPGLAMIALSEKAWTATESSDLPKFYFDRKKPDRVDSGDLAHSRPARKPADDQGRRPAQRFQAPRSSCARDPRRDSGDGP